MGSFRSEILEPNNFFRLEQTKDLEIGV